MKTGRRTATGLSIMLAALCLGSIDAPAKGEQPAPAARGKGYNKRELGPGGPCKNIRLAWSTTCRQPAGRGLALDGLDQGVNQLNELPRPHTRILEDGTWKNIYPELREKNPLQSYCDKANELKVALRRARARTRHIWFKGLEPEAERARLDKEAVPAFHEFLSSFEAIIVDLRSTPHLHAEDASQIPSMPGNLPDLSRVVSDGRADSPAYAGGAKYELGQVSFAMGHFNAARELLKTAEKMTRDVLSADHINAMQRAQVHIELGAEALDAEPPARVLSVPAYDAKTGLYVLFGGDHFDYLTNDTWVFDPKERKWFQRHPEGAPPPRGKHIMTAKDDGIVSMQGGYYYPARRARYASIGPDAWIYDIEKNTWTGPESVKPMPPDTRQYHGGAERPGYFLRSPKPNAAEHAKVLASLPVNTWVDLKPPFKRAGSRAWGTMAYDTENDLIVDWNGGHSTYCSSDAPHYHLGVNRWELPYPAEIQLGMVGASAAAVCGYSFNRRHWITNHTWDHYLYDPRLKKVLVVGSMSNWEWKWDRFSYVYDPVLGEWESRFPKGNGLEGVFPAGMSTLHTPIGTLVYGGNGKWWIIDYEAMGWKRFADLKSGTWPRNGCSDWYGHVYDPTANRILATALPMPRSAYNGKVIYALDLATKKASVLKPENPEVFGDGLRYNREWRYIPDLKIAICGGSLVKHVPEDKRHSWHATDDMPAYDPVNNRWIVLHFKGRPSLGFGGSMHYDEKRKLLWALDMRGNVKALRVDFEKAVADDAGKKPANGS